VIIRPGTLAARLYGTAEATEDYYCNYGVNPEYDQLLEDGGLRVSGHGGTGEIRIVEIPGHPFFLATLFVPQARSTALTPHPLLAGYAAAVNGAGQKKNLLETATHGGWGYAKEIQSRPAGWLTMPAPGWLSMGDPAWLHMGDPGWLCLPDPRWLTMGRPLTPRGGSGCRWCPTPRRTPCAAS